MFFLKNSNTILEDQQGVIDSLKKSTFKLQKTFNTENYTEIYSRYNIFSITSTDLLMYNLFEELKGFIRKNLNTDKPLWIQSWLNYQTQDDVLMWHNHKWPWHGYISVDPKNTTTVFENWEIENKIGQIYFGDGGILHKVVVNAPYPDYRITIGYDVTDGMDNNNLFSLIPI